MKAKVKRSGEIIEVDKITETSYMCRHNDATRVYLEHEVAILDLTLNEYQNQAMETCMTKSENVAYMLFGLVEEVGELAAIVSKGIRKGDVEFNFNGFDRYTSEFQHKMEIMKKEAGDVLWMLSGFCSVMGWTLEDVAKTNLEKLSKRKASGTIATHNDH